MAVAYFITFTTYGTWLHGTEKGFGSVDNENNTYGAPFLAPNTDRLEEAREAMVQPPYTLSAAARAVVLAAVIDLCREKGWKLWGAHVRSNHVHVVTFAERDPGRILADLKARASRELTRAGFEDSNRRRWSRHGSTRHLFNDAALRAAVRYTLDGQGESMAKPSVTEQ